MTHPRRFNPVLLLVTNLVVIATATLSIALKPDGAPAFLGLAALGFASVQVMIHQWRTHSEECDRFLKRKDDLFDRRWKIYAGVREFLDAMSPMTRASTVAGKRAAELYETEKMRRIRERVGFKVSVTTHTLGLAQQSLRALMVEAHFLFGEDVNGYLEELNERCNRLQEIHRRQDARLPNIESGVEVSDWFSEQDDHIRQKFEPYLRLP